MSGVSKVNAISSKENLPSDIKGVVNVLAGLADKETLKNKGYMAGTGNVDFFSINPKERLY
jgi:hypothetical protein